MHDIAHFLRPGHLQQLRNILDDPEASDNDRFVALDLLKNASIAAGGVLPMCQDTGTAIVKGKKGQFVFTGGGDEAAIAARRPRHVPDVATCATARWRRSTCTTSATPAPTCRPRSRSPPSTATPTSSCSWPRAAAAPTRRYLYQETKALLNEATLLPWIFDKMQALGTVGLPAVPPRRRHRRHVGRVRRRDGQAGLDALPRLAAHARARPPATGSATSSSSGKVLRARPDDRHRRPVRRQVLLPRRAHHPPPPPRRAAARWRWPCRARPTARRSARSPSDGVFLEQLETDPARFLPEVTDEHLDDDARSCTSTSPGR